MDSLHPTRLSQHPEISDALAAIPNGEQLASLLDRAECVSFDFFDTLFARPFLDAELTFDLLGRKTGVEHFRRKRTAAQREAFRRMHEEGRREIRLSDIYACFDADHSTREHISAAETELELSLLAPKPKMLRLFHALQRAGIRLAISSDMYLPKEFFLQVCRRHGLDAIDHLLVSAEANATKRDAGELFDVLIQQSGFEAHAILHIGDHPIADVQRAMERGLLAFHYHDPAPDAVPGEKPPPTLHGLWERCDIEDGGLGEFERLGFLYGGPANLGYLKWLMNQVERDGIEHLLFLSRDGFLLQKLADQLPDGSLPKHAYFLGSRVAFYLAAITEKNYSAYIPFLLSGSAGLKPREIFERIGVPSPAEEVMRDLGLGAEISITHELDERLAQLLYAWRAEVLKICRRNRRVLRLYLASLGIREGAKLGLVDVGWSGSTQEAIEAALRPWIDIQVTGYYFCLADTPEREKRDKTQRMRSMYSAANLGIDRLHRLYANRAIVELFFSAPHPTVIGWQMTRDEKIEPIFDKGRGGSPDDLMMTCQQILLGAEHFSSCYASMSTQAGVELSEEELTRPLLHLATDAPAEARMFASRVVNFDTWSSSANLATNLMTYT